MVTLRHLDPSDPVGLFRLGRIYLCLQSKAAAAFHAGLSVNGATACEADAHIARGLRLSKRAARIQEERMRRARL
ncbi:hypothetical protein [Paracraurococcus lichenis]|uniref:Tetratricopeptide repeat protein n=1 Tax=Paracraurococcus lichenis TaxID=3064888 RepID=A0ABT9EAB8_9PROT|nr:hypothetical protein [Paracraurococcus sp. LOR1-02]MDO9713156.1 hypothetical protein [Paracraurococcus sp. LOR1-02]